MDNGSRPTGQIIATLYYEDVEGACAWLSKAFGFAERFRYGSADRVSGVQIVAGHGIVMLSESRTGQGPDWQDQASLRSPRPNEVNVVMGVHVDDVDKHHTQAVEAGARILRAPQTHPFGERQYTAEDLAGYRWAFSQTVADVAPEEWGATPGSAYDEAPTPG